MTRNKSLLPTIGAAGLGAGLMYLMDPEAGPRRRALIRDKFVHLGHETEDFVSGQTRNLKNHAAGWMHEAKDMFRHSPMAETMDEGMSGPADDTLGREFVTND
jgi:hypothetical protein